MKSSLYFGKVSHHRRSPKAHHLNYNVYMAHLFLDELEDVFNGRLFWSVNHPNVSSFQRADYHRPDIASLEEAVRSTLRRQLGQDLSGRISVLTHLRTFGYCFNPVTFYYLWDKQEVKPKAVLTEITNTPWGEKYAKSFLWDESDTTKIKHAFRKEFHVSPFIGMDVDYDWHFHPPAKQVKVDMFLKQEGKLFFSAHLLLKQKPISALNLAWALLRFPWITLQITSSIYWNAFLLWAKGCPFYSHPKHAVSANE
ncbi:MAG: DUF1365 domain-containing protein [Opitutales bacterium]|nr:DUF1365 domain-containing protein [Opitutales bacterium]